MTPYRYLRPAALILVLFTTGCSDELAVSGNLVRDGKPFGPADGETMVLTLTGPILQHDFNVNPDGSFALAHGADCLKPGEYKAVVVRVRMPSAAGLTAPGGIRPPTPGELRRPVGPPPPPELKTYPLPPVVIEPGRAVGYTIEVPPSPAEQKHSPASKAVRS
jgi:hypothetical protein